MEYYSSMCCIIGGLFAPCPWVYLSGILTHASGILSYVIVYIKSVKSPIIFLCGTCAFMQLYTTPSKYGCRMDVYSTQKSHETPIGTTLVLLVNIKSLVDPSFLISGPILWSPFIPCLLPFNYDTKIRYQKFRYVLNMAMLQSKPRAPQALLSCICM